MKKFSTVTMIALLLAVAPSAMAQQAQVTGTVADATGALIPGAEVAATNVNTGISTLQVSGETGNYAFQSLQPGAYSIVATLPGFSDATIEVNLTGNQTFRFDFELQVGAVATAVEVVSDADALLAVTGASVGDALPEYEVTALPLATRDVFDLLGTTAGLVRSQNGDGTNFAGGRVNMVNTTRDGVPVSDGRYLDWNGAFSATYSSPDLVEEIQITVGTVDAAAGRGSSQVRLQTRSGTNEFHGALFYTTNNSALNANSWFDNLNNREKQYENRHQFGGRIGGPIIPNRMFFFVLLDEQRYALRQNVTGPVLTAQARQGNFRYWDGFENRNASAGANSSVDAGGAVISRPTGTLQTFNVFSDVNDPFRGSGISNNAYIQETLARMPAPNNFRTGDGLNTAGHDWVRRISGVDNSAGTSQNTNRDNLNVRLDYQVTDGNSVSFIMSREHNFVDAYQPSWPTGFRNGNSIRTPRIYTVAWTSTISPTVLNEFRFGERETSWHGRASHEDGCCFGSDQRLDNLTPEGALAQSFIPTTGNGYPYHVSLGTLDGRIWLGTGGRSQRSPLYTFSDNISWIMGAHSFTAGWEGVWADSDGWSGGGLHPETSTGNGNFDITGIQGQFAGLQNNDADTAEDLLNDLAGTIDTQDQTYVVNDPARGFDDILVSNKRQQNYHQDDWAAFIKDDWNVSSNLTLNYGVRWDVYGVPYERLGINTYPRDYNIFVDGFGDETEIITVGKNSLNPDLNIYEKDWNNIAPSFGFSYNVPWIDRQTVVRGGYGISYAGAPTFLEYDQGPGANQGKTSSVDLNPITYTALPGSTNPSAAEAVFPIPNPRLPYETVQLTDSCRAGRRCNLYVYAQDRRIPYIQNMNLSIETELGANTNLSVTWLATKGTSLMGGRQLNEPEIRTNGILEAFITTRQGEDAPLFANMFEGLDFGSGVIGTDISASAALRQWSRTDDFFSDGEAAGFAEFITETNRGGGGYGGMLRANGYPENFIKVNPQFNTLDYYDNGDSSTYHSLQTQVTKRLSRGLSGQFTYTWSKAMGNGGTANQRQHENRSFWTRDPKNRALQHSVVPFHRTHAFNAHSVWQLPFGPGRALGSGAPSAVARVIEGWQLSTIFSWNSGQPINLLTGSDIRGSGGLKTLAAEDQLNTPDVVGDIASFGKATGEVTVNANGEINYLSGFTREAEPVLNYYGAGDPGNLADSAALFQIRDPSGNVILKNPQPGTTGNLGATG